MHALLIVALTSCSGGAAGSPGTGAAATLAAECRGDLGTSATARSFAAFLDAVHAYAGAADRIDAQLGESCRALGADLGMTAAALELQGPSTLAVCGQFSARLREDLGAARAARVGVRLEQTEPACVTRFGEYRSCLERCEPRLAATPGAGLRCDGGELRGFCGADCAGACAVRAEGACAGACEGTCSGGCAGICHGVCAGECSQRSADGACHGECRGTCHGDCTEGCAGSCQGTCVVASSSSCGGECRGSCSIDFAEPVCTGRVAPPRVRDECRAICDAVQLALRVCAPGESRLFVDAPRRAPRARQIAGAVAARMPGIHALRHRLADLREAGERLARDATGFVAGVADLGETAAGCGAQAAAVLPRTLGRVSVGVQATSTLTAALDRSAILD